MKSTTETYLNPTINDIARVAEVSLATVDRVLNARPGVREKTISKVNKAIAELGYVRDAAAANLARGRVYNFVFILPANDNEFVSSLQAQIDQLNINLRHDRTVLSFVRVAAFDPMALSAAINAIDKSQVDGGRDLWTGNTFGARFHCASQSEWADRGFFGRRYSKLRAGLLCRH